MKSFIQTLKNIYKIEELRSRILFTLMIILIYRLGSKVVLPGVDPTALEAFSAAYFPGSSRFARYVFRRGFFPGIYFCPGYYALHLSFHHYPVADHCSTLFSAYAERR